MPEQLPKERHEEQINARTLNFFRLGALGAFARVLSYGWEFELFRGPVPRRVEIGFLKLAGEGEMGRKKRVQAAGPREATAACRASGGVHPIRRRLIRTGSNALYLLATLLTLPPVLAETASAPSPEAQEPDRLTGDWGGSRTRLEERGISLAPRLTQYYQGLNSGEGDHGYEYGGKADLLLNADLGKLGFWNGFSMTVHAEYNFGQRVNGRGGTVVPVNTGLAFPGEGGDSDAFDLSSVYFGQKFGESSSLLFGKINMIDIASTKPFMGGAGIDGFWNTTFAAPPSGTVPPYLFGALLSVKTEPATYGLWVYDPNSVVNESGLDDPFGDGYTVRGSVDFPVSLGGLGGHQGFAASYSTLPGNDLADVGRLLLPTPVGSPDIKDNRYYVAYSFDQYLYQSKVNPKEGFGLFGQFGISDGNPNPLYRSLLLGVGGTGLISGRSRDNWGFGFYYDDWSSELQDSLEPVFELREEKGMEIFYNAAVMPGVTVGADLQIIKPSLSNDTAVFSGLRMVLRF